MRILFPAAESEATIESPVERILGNAQSFFVYDTQLETSEVIANIFLLTDDIKCKLTQYLVSKEIDVVVACEVCPNCFEKFEENTGIDMWRCDGSKNIRESLNKFIIGGLFVRTKPDLCNCIHHQDEKAKIVIGKD
jgi:predicted Fe-Mo cluster-binding NifX family protein